MADHDLTALLLTLNEQENIGRVLQRLDWIPHIIVVDSGSDDDTLSILERYPRVTVLHRDFTTHAEQWNFGLAQVDTAWVLTLDADYLLPEHAETVIGDAIRNAGVAGYSAGFEYRIYGKRVNGSILPPRTLLFKPARARYWDDGHTQRLKLDGAVDELPLCVAHDDRKPMRRWMHSQINYAALEARKLLSEPVESLTAPDKIRRYIVFAPLLVFVLVYFLRGAFLNGWRGFYYAVQRTFAELALSLCLLEHKLDRRLSTGGRSDDV